MGGAFFLRAGYWPSRPVRSPGRLGSEVGSGELVDNGGIVGSVGAENVGAGTGTLGVEFLVGVDEPPDGALDCVPDGAGDFDDETGPGAVDGPADGPPPGVQIGRAHV